MVSQQDFGASMVGGALAIGLIGVGLGAAENLIRHRGRLKVGKTSRRIIPARIFRRSKSRRRRR